ncbi:hypothetical protein SUGI_0003220 [Cryptomeria japonica]|uniref:uncharacterized protein LOC131038914 isoform X2 n=1 Tax=Cryptomeria japonica TaxID=3369 RepID=UPI002408DB8D|nr:uncharacterized protein LOC131038914 isoform X2 [Cryptomeria japonica]GLJ04783.1 hypothetical protein SUGI_0003220 [Cryptomeria japonica]
MSGKRTGETLNIIREFAKTPKRSLGTPRRVPVDSNGNEIAKTPRRIPRTSISKSLPQRSVSLGCNTPSKTPCQLQVSPNQARSHLISSKLNEHHHSSGACTPRELKAPNISSDEVENSLVLLNSEIVSEKENIFVINDEFAGKEDTPFKGKMFAEGNTSGRKERILSLLSRFQKRENFVRSPALRVDVKDSVDGCGRKRNFFVSKSSTESNNNQFQQCERTDGNVGKKIDAPKSSTKSHINKSDAAKSSQSHINKLHESKRSPAQKKLDV